MPIGNQLVESNAETDDATPSARRFVLKIPADPSANNNPIGSGSRKVKAMFASDLLLNFTVLAATLSGYDLTPKQIISKACTIVV